jgi:hypothetical protein
VTFGVQRHEHDDHARVRDTRAERRVEEARLREATIDRRLQETVRREQALQAREAQRVSPNDSHEVHDLLRTLASRLSALEQPLAARRGQHII